MADEPQQPAPRSKPRSSPSNTEIRRAGRELALAVMCALEAYASDDDQGRSQARALTLDNPPRGDTDGEAAFSDLARTPAARLFAEELLDLWAGQRQDLDEVIEKVSRRWRLARMDHVDRNVVRLAATELASRPGTPRGVVLAEAVRLARRYGSERSAPFVNGLVESAAQHLRPDGESQPAPEQDTTD